MFDYYYYNYYNCFTLQSMTFDSLAQNNFSAFSIDFFGISDTVFELEYFSRYTKSVKRDRGPNPYYRSCIHMAPYHHIQDNPIRRLPMS